MPQSEPTGKKPPLWDISKKMDAFLQSFAIEATNPSLPFSYAIRRSQRASKIRIVVKPGLVEVVAPIKAAEHKIHQFVHDQQKWVTEALAKMAAKTQIHENTAPTHYSHGSEIPYQGKSFKLIVKKSKLKRVKIEFLNEFIAHIPESMPDSDHSDYIRSALVNWLKKQAKPQVEQLISRHAGKYNLYPRSISIKKQKSRWGSCGVRNDISINWLLLLAPVDIMEYVVVHELCHIRVKNHSPQFWAFVAEHLADFRERRLWLKKHGSRLMLGL
jgi:predicted metal-dependent hydrolase